MAKNLLALMSILLVALCACAQHRPTPTNVSTTPEGKIKYADFLAGDPQVAISQEVVVEYLCISNPGNPPTGSVRVYCDSGTGKLTCINHTGGACLSTSGGTVTAVTGTSPIVSSGGTTPAISCPTCTVSGVTSVTASSPLSSSGGTTPNLTLPSVPSSLLTASANTNTGLFSFSQTGTYTLGANRFNWLNSLTNGTDCDANGAYTQYNATQVAASVLADTLTGCVSLPAGSGLVTNTENNAISGFAINNNSSQQNQFPSGGGPSIANAIHGVSWCKAANTNCEGVVSEITDSASLSGVTLVGMEVGSSINNTGTHAYGFLSSAFGNTQAAFDNYPAFDVHIGGIGTGRVTSGFRCEQSAIFPSGSNFAPCLVLNPNSDPANSVSQAIRFNSLNNSSAIISAQLIQSETGDGKPQLQYVPPSGTGASFTTYAIQLAGTGNTAVSGCSISAQHGGTVGDFTSGTTGTCTVTIAMPVQAFVGWSCRADDLTTPADAIHQTAKTQTTATLSGTTVSGDVISYLCLAY